MAELDGALKRLIGVEATHFGLDPQFIEAIALAEGGTAEAIFSAVSKSVKDVQSVRHAVEITCRTVVHAMRDYINAVEKGLLVTDFLTTLGERWAPVGAANDPKGLNKNWVRNVSAILERQKTGAKPPVRAQRKRQGPKAAVSAEQQREGSKSSV